MVFNYNLPQLVASPIIGSLIDFGILGFGNIITLTDVVSIANTGDDGTFIDLLGATFAGDLVFSLASGNDFASLLGNGSGGTSELFSLSFDTTVGVGVYNGGNPRRS